MKPAISNLFFKQATCPSSETLLAYGASLQGMTEEHASLREHLAACEFCDAELRLLAEHCPQEWEECPTVTIPLNLRRLAEAVLSGKAQSMESLFGAYEKEGLTLTDA